MKVVVIVLIVVVMTMRLIKSSIDYFLVKKLNKKMKKLNKKLIEKTIMTMMTMTYQKKKPIQNPQRIKKNRQR